jgi:hypothetical protein
MRKEKKEKSNKQTLLDQFKCNGDACNLIPEGTKVRYLFEFPIDYLTKKKIGSKFSEQISDGRPMIMKKPVFY